MNSASLSLNRFRSSSWFEPGAVFLTIVLVLLAFLVLSPIYLLLVSSLQSGDGAAYSFASWIAAFNEPGILKAFWNTLMVTGVVQCISIPIAIVIAWLIARTDMSAPLLLFFVYVSFRSGQFLLFTGNPLLGFAFPSRSPSLPLVTARLPPSFSADQKNLHWYDQRHQCKDHDPPASPWAFGRQWPLAG